MGRYKKPDLDKYKDMPNPFTNNWVFNVRKVNPKPGFNLLGQTPDGHAIVDILPPPVENSLKEQEPAAKVYTSEIFRKQKAMLSPKALHLYMWMIDSADSGSDLVTVNVNRYVAECEGREYNAASNKKPSSGKYNTYKLAWEELVLKGMIARTNDHNVFWLNPAFFFKGSRIKKYPKNYNIYYTRAEEEQMSDDKFWAMQPINQQ